MSSPLRILHVSTYLHPDHKGGAERVVTGLARAQARAGHEVTVVTGDHGRRGPGESRDGVRVRYFPMPAGVRGFRFYRAARSGCRSLLARLPDREFDLLHTHQPATAVTALGMPWLGRVRIHSFYAPYNAEWAAEAGPLDPLAPLTPGFRLKRSVLALLDRRCLALAERVVVLSETSRRQAEELLPGVAARIDCVPPGVDLDRFHPAARREGNSRPLILSVRRLIRRMGLDLALEAAALLRDQGCEFELLIAGEGPRAGSLEASIQALGLDDRVRLCGAVEEADLPALYRRADLFLLPSRRLEGFGMVTLEALACGTPVIGTDVGATHELLRELTPELAPAPPRPDRLAAALRRALDQLEPSREAALRAAGRIAARYGWPAAAARMERVYREALARELVS